MSDEPLSTKGGVIEVRLQDANQLFDAMDPSPFYERELNYDAEEYIVESALELSTRVLQEVVIYIARPQEIKDPEAIGVAIREHFARRSALVQSSLRRLIKQGFVSLIVGLTFMTLMFGASQMLDTLLGQHAAAQIFREGLLIIGWVAMWKPLEILLYDWWPILVRRRLLDRLSRVQVRVVASK